MKFTVQEKAKCAFLTDDGGDKCFSLVNSNRDNISSYVCYYDSIKKGHMPFALTEKGVQIPVPTKDNRRAVKFLTYDELVALVKAGSACADECDCKPEDNK